MNAIACRLKPLMQKPFPKCRGSYLCVGIEDAMVVIMAAYQQDMMGLHLHARPSHSPFFMTLTIKLFLISLFLQQPMLTARGSQKECLLSLVKARALGLQRPASFRK